MTGQHLLKRYEERLLEDMSSPQWILAVGDPPPILRLPVEILVHIVNMLTEKEAQERIDLKSVLSLRWYLASSLTNLFVVRTDKSAA